MQPDSLLRQAPVRRRRSAVLAADVVDYSRLMGEDEQGTHDRVKACLIEVIEPAILDHHGRVVRLIGDGVLAEFAEVAPAIDCGVAIQRRQAARNASVRRGRRILFRIGINYGEVIVDDDGIYGNGVNVAGRLEALADPGGLFVSGSAREQLQGDASHRYASLGDHLLKNLPEPVAVYRVVLDPVGDALPLEPIPAVPATAPLPPCPYRGLFAFREEDAACFFGRQNTADELQSAADGRSLVAVLGASGSGKSSAVFAGLVPRLRAAGGWLIAGFRPDRTPLRNLLAAILPLRNRVERQEAPRDELDFWQARLNDGRATLGELVDQILAANDGAQRLLLIADQFEQIYTLVEDPEERERFLGLVLDLTQAAGAPAARRATLILTLRADFLGRMLTSRRLADALKGADVKLGPMTEEELRAAIENPARREGVRFEMGLVDRILMDVRGQTGSLPLLEFALTELWARQRHGRLTHVGYEEIGGVAEAIAGYAEEVYRALAPQEQEQVRQIFLQLVRPGEGTEDTRRIASRTEIRDERWHAITRLANARLVVTQHDETSGEDTAEVVHEALIREWQRLREWVDGDREFLVWRQRLAEACREWQRQDRAGGYLLRAAPLAVAADWLATRGDELTDEDRAFILTSRAREHREVASRQRRRRVVIAGLAAASLLFFALFVGTGAFWRQASEQKRSAQVTQSLFRADQSLQQLEAGNVDVALLLALPALPADLADPERPYVGEAEAQLYRAVAANRGQQVLRGHTGAVWDAVVSPDGGLIATAGEDGSVRVWPVDKGELGAARTFEGHRLAVLDLAFSPDGRAVASGSADRTARIWNLDSEQSVVLAGHTDVVAHVEFSPDGQRVLTASWDGTARLWERASGTQLGPALAGHHAPLTDAGFDPSGTRVVTTSLDGAAIIWDARTGQPLLPPLRAQAGPVWHAAFDPAGDRLITAAEGRQVNAENLGVAPTKRVDTLQLWDARSGARLLSFEGHAGGVLDARFSAPSPLDGDGGRLLLTASRDGTTRLWDTRSGQQLVSFEGHEGPVLHAIFSPSGRTIATASRDGTARVWATASGKPLGLPQRHAGAVLAIAFTPDDRQIVTASEDGTARLAEAEPGRQLAVLDRHHGPVGLVTFGPRPGGPAQRQLVLTASRDHSVWQEQMKGDNAARLWDARTGEHLAVLEGHTASVRAAAFSRDGRRIITASEDRTAAVWAIHEDATVAREQTLEGHQGAVLDAALSPDGAYAATASADGTARLWDLQSGRQQVLVPEQIGRHAKPVLLARFSPDGLRLVTAAADGTSWLWHEQKATHDFVLESQLDAATGGVLSVAFSPNGELIATATSMPEGEVSLWSATTHGLVGTLRGHAGAVDDVEFSDDGHWIATASEDDTARVWDATTLAPVAVMQGHLSGVPSVDFAPGGGRPRIVTGSWDSSVRLWDGLTGEQLAEFLGHELGVPQVEFSPDGRLVASASWDGTARLWAVMEDGQTLIDSAQRIAADLGLELTARQRAAFHVDE